MSDDNTDDAPDAPPPHSDPVETLGDAAGQIGTGLDAAANQIPEEEEEARAAVETAGDVANAVAQVVQAAEAADDLGEALEAGDEGRAASAVGNLTGGVLGTAGSLVDGVAGTMPEEAQGALNTVANVTRGAAGAARVTEQVVSTFQAVERAVSGRAVRFRTSAEVDRLVAERASGKQRLGELYEFKVLVEHSEEGGLDGESVDALLSHPARVGVNREHGDGEVSGMLRRVEMLSVASSHHGHAHYELTLVPKLWRLRLVTRSRVFMDMTHLEVVLAVLEEHGFDAGRYVLDHTEESYPTHETVVQYRESDFDFVYRLLQHNGIHTRFEQNPRGEALVLGDRNASFVPVPSHEELRYHPQDFAPDDGAPRVFEMRQIREPRVGEVILRDFNWRTPHAPVRAEAPVDEATGYGSLDLYGEHVHDEAEARRLATVRAEEQLVGGHRFVGKTSLRGVAPGTYFDLSGHPHGEMNRRYLVIATDEAMDEGHAYFNTFTAIPFDVTYRPRRTVRWPRVNGAVHAIVDGEARSTATPIDDAGRYRLVLPYDVGGAAGGRASRWVRRAQPSAGAGYGMHLPLHIGTEVAVVHLNGDPDRPLIVGAVPNAATEAPVIAANAPQSVIRTGSGVVFELDDDC